MVANKYQFILGSASPRRKELLESLFIPFRIHSSDIDEHSEYKNVEEFVMDISLQKAESVFVEMRKKYSNPLVLGADTIVVVDEEILGKPCSREEASRMLKKLSGRKHYVYTGVALFDGTRRKLFCEKTSVEFESISETLLELYLDTGESMDKAGAYGIQKYALSFIKKIEGSYSNVVGLPVNLVLEEVSKFICNGENNFKWRELLE